MSKKKLTRRGKAIQVGKSDKRHSYTEQTTDRLSVAWASNLWKKLV